MNDMRQTIIPKSDQLNSDDLIGRDLTIKITGVNIKGGQEQPVSVHFEGDDGKPYKACKSMCRVMVTAWGPDSSKYVGRSMTLYRDPKVRWGGMEVGGIRISHMSDIAEDMTMALTVTRANKRPFTVKPIKAEKAKESVALARTPQTEGEKSLTEAAEAQVAADTFITPDQAIDIADKLKESGVSQVDFLGAVGVASVALIPAKDKIGRDNYQKSLKWIAQAKEGA